MRGGMQMLRISRGPRRSIPIKKDPSPAPILHQWARPALALLPILIWLTLACGEEAATATSIPTTLPSPTPLGASTLGPTDTPTPSPTPPPTTPPTATPSAGPTITPTPTPTQTPFPSPTAEPTPTPPVVPLRLEVTFPPGDLVVDSETITITGIASPDATVSVNGNLAIPDVEGHFSMELTIPPWDNPLNIEVIASSLAGETRSEIRTVIFVQ